MQIRQFFQKGSEILLPSKCTRTRAIGLWSRCLFTSTFQKFGYDYDDYDYSIRMGPKCTSVKRALLVHFGILIFRGNGKFLHWNSKSFSKIGSVSMKVSQFQLYICWEWEGWISPESGSCDSLSLCCSCNLCHLEGHFAAACDFIINFKSRV